MRLTFRRRMAVTATGAAVAASALTAGTAGAWVCVPAHSASGQTVAGTVRIIYTNPLDRTITCTVRIYPASKVTTLRRAAHLRNLSETQRAQQKKPDARKSATRARAKAASAGRPLYESRTPTKVSPGSTRVVYWSSKGRSARSYSALSECRNGGQTDTTAILLRPIDV